MLELDPNSSLAAKLSTGEVAHTTVSTPLLRATGRVFFDYGCAFGDFRAAYKAKNE